MALSRLKAEAEVVSLADVGARSQDATNAEVNRLASLIMTGAKLIEGFAVGTGDTLLWHNLGRRIKGWQVVRQSTFTILYEGTASTDEGRYLNLRAGAACTVSLLVF